MQSNGMAINRALLKYGYSNFSLSILEYCDINMLMLREKHYLVLLKPEYNLTLKPGSPSRNSGRFVSEETEDKMILVAKNITKEARACIKINNLQRNNISLEVTNIETGSKTIYPSAGSAARALGLYQSSISLYLRENRKKPFKGKYLFKQIHVK
jgi:hypothetical protein